MTRTEAIAKAFGLQAEIASRAAEVPREMHRTLTEANKVIPDRVLEDFDAEIRSGAIAKQFAGADDETVAAIAVLVRVWVERLSDAYVSLAERMHEKAIELETRAKTMQEASGVLQRAVDVAPQATDATTPDQ